MAQDLVFSSCTPFSLGYLAYLAYSALAWPAKLLCYHEAGHSGPSCRVVVEVLCLVTRFGQAAATSCHSCHKQTDTQLTACISCNDTPQWAQCLSEACRNSSFKSRNRGNIKSHCYAVPAAEHSATTWPSSRQLVHARSLSKVS